MQLPVRFARYELQEFLGGGMSHVYRAVDVVLGRPVAVKILTEQGIKDEDARQRFLQEARTSGTIQHDHIVTVHDYGEEQGYPFIVMEFLHGEDLREAIRRGHTGDGANKLRIALEIARALEYIHSRGIIHRDIKPENIFVEQGGRCKLMDFGIAKSEGLNLTKDGTSMGTPFYMSPEQVMGAKITPLVDVYSFGMVMYELFSGVKPVVGDTLQRLFYMILNETPDPQHLVATGTPEPLIRLILWCIGKKPEDRPANFSIVVEHLQALRDGAAPRPAPTPAPAPAPAVSAPAAVAAAETGGGGSRGLMIGGAAAAVLVIAGLAAWYFLRPPAGGGGEGKSGKSDTAMRGGAMVTVTAGPFPFGESKTGMNLTEYQIDRTEVSNAAYQEFASASGHPLPVGFAKGSPTLPVVNVSFDDAQSFCAWAGKRLPNEWEWEKAARGAEGRVYPWGDDMNPALAVVKENPETRGLAPVDSYEKGASPYGALHMTGNAWEWVAKRHTPSALALESLQNLLKPPPSAQEPWYYVKGGAFDEPLASGVLYEWSSVPARYSRPSVGFRCVK